MNARQQIFDATEQVLRVKGFAGTTREIARIAGCADSTLYNHFGSKEDLLMAVLQENLPDFVWVLR